MIHYFFDLTDGNLLVEDRVGLELADVLAARECATVLAIDKIGERQISNEIYDARELHIRGPGGLCVAKIAFRYISA